MRLRAVVCGSAYVVPTVLVDTAVAGCFGVAVAVDLGAATAVAAVVGVPVGADMAAVVTVAAVVGVGVAAVVAVPAVVGVGVVAALCAGVGVGVHKLPPAAASRVAVVSSDSTSLVCGCRMSICGGGGRVRVAGWTS